jgi:hypothetical protein
MGDLPRNRDVEASRARMFVIFEMFCRQDLA